MGRRGPRPTPTALKVLRGNPGKRPLNRREPRPQLEGVRCPSTLTGRARKEWRRLAPELVRQGVLTVADRGVFETYCRLTQEVEEYQDLVVRVGTEASHRLGYASHLMKLRTQLRLHAAELGLSPSSRSSVVAVPPPLQVPGDGFARLMAQSKRGNA
jgi:P27 family predicted phage terminase small subunit